MTEPLLLMRDDDWFATFRSVEEPLLLCLDQATTELRAGDEDAWDLPLDQIDGNAAYNAWLHIWQALPQDVLAHIVSSRAEYSAVPGVPQIYGSDTEYAELLRLDIDPDQVQVLADTLAALQQVLAGGLIGQLGELLEIIAADAPTDQFGKQSGPQQLVLALAAVVGVLALPSGDDTELLLQVLADNEGAERIDLTAVEMRAYRDFSRRWIAASSIGNTTDDALRHYGLRGSL